MSFAMFETFLRTPSSLSLLRMQLLLLFCDSLEPGEINAFDTSAFSLSRKLFICAAVNLSQHMMTYAFDHGGKTMKSYLE